MNYCGLLMELIYSMAADWQLEHFLEERELLEQE